jgi:hypothetical protein
MPLLHFYPPLQAQNYLYDFCSLNEILHKLTSCHFTLRNKTLNDLCLKILLFSLLRTKNCTIHQRTITQTHDLSRHYFSLKTRFLLHFFPFSLPLYRTFHYSFSKTFFFQKLLNFTFKILHLKYKIKR